ncbi:MAG: hypothetical protein FWG98_06590 [Candidatus Cloacimonetes bacterium]|nr:hypothetical protein [Candidatus Cloacimonadota bacterium]
MSRINSPSKTGDNPEIILCKKSQRFENIIVCTINCRDRCAEYRLKFDIDLLKKYIETYPDYEMKGVIMPVSKQTIPTTTKTTKEKIYWIVAEENKVLEVTESEIINNPAQYIGKPMYEKPKDQYEIIVTIKKKAN